jgi:hypothetical protein
MAGHRESHQHSRLPGSLDQFASQSVIGQAVSYVAALAYRRPGGPQSSVETVLAGDGGEIDPRVESDSGDGSVGELVVVEPRLVALPSGHVWILA